MTDSSRQRLLHPPPATCHPQHCTTLTLVYANHNPRIKYSQCNSMCLTATPRIFITIPVSPCSIPGCNASCCVPVSSTTYTSRLWKKLVQTFPAACHNTSEHMFTLCLQCVYNVFTISLQYLYIKLGRDEKSNDTLSAAAAEWMFMIINSGLFNSEAVGIYQQQAVTSSKSARHVSYY